MQRCSCCLVVLRVSFIYEYLCQGQAYSYGSKCFFLIIFHPFTRFKFNITIHLYLFLLWKFCLTDTAQVVDGTSHFHHIAMEESEERIALVTASPSDDDNQMKHDPHKIVLCLPCNLWFDDVLKFIGHHSQRKLRQGTGKKN